jgi:PKD repeat protein
MSLIINPPDAANPAIGIPAQTVVSFTDTDPDTTYRRWDFGDGAILLNSASVSHIYSSTGNFTLMLLRSTGSEYQTIFVQPPVAGKYSPTFVITGIIINPPTISLTDWAAISVTVKNTGSAAGAATMRITDDKGTWIADVTTPPIAAGGTQSTVASLARVQGINPGQIKICADFMMGV